MIVAFFWQADNSPGNNFREWQGCSIHAAWLDYGAMKSDDKYAYNMKTRTM